MATEITRLVKTGWGEEMEAGLRADASSLRIICPFIKTDALSRLLAFKPAKIQVITRFNLNDFSVGVNDTEALAALLDAGGQVRGVSGLHAKIYLFGNARAIVTSANLTQSGLGKNYEFGLVTEDDHLIATCQTHFADLWGSAGPDLERDRLSEWEGRIDSDREENEHPNKRKWFGDFGTVVREIPSPFDQASIATSGASSLRTGPPAKATDGPRAFVKFFGTGDARIDPSATVIDQIKELGCYWGLTYPEKKRPRQVRNGDAIFIGRYTCKPDDFRIFGRAIGKKHVEGRDDATPAEKKRWSHAAKWPRYLRVYDAEFFAGTLEDGVSLNELMDDLEADSLAPTQRNKRLGEGNIDPRRSKNQQAGVELSPEGFDWLNERLEVAFDTHGRIIPKDTPDDFDWPDIKRVGKRVIR